MKLYSRTLFLLVIILCCLFGTSCFASKDTATSSTTSTKNTIGSTLTLQSMPPMTCPTVQADKNYEFNNLGPDIGDTAVDFTLIDISGNKIVLSRLLADKPVVLIFGSFT